MSSGGNGIVDMYHSFGSLAFVAMHRFEDPVGDLLGRDLTGGAMIFLLILLRQIPNCGRIGVT